MINYSTCGIISRGLYTFYPIFHCGLYCRAFSITDNLFFHFLPKIPRFIIESGFKLKASYNEAYTVYNLPNLIWIWNSTNLHIPILSYVPAALILNLQNKKRLLQFLGTDINETKGNWIWTKEISIVEFIEQIILLLQECLLQFLKNIEEFDSEN